MNNKLRTSLFKETGKAALSLQPTVTIARPLSVIEYYHASISSNNCTLEPPRQSIFVLEGWGREFEPERWRRALDAASAANPGTRLRMVGTGWRTRWKGDGLPVRLRLIEQIDWDASSSEGSEFIGDTPLSLEKGQAIELVLVNSSPRGRLVILRALHAVMDGSGGLHFLAEVFRVLRNEPVLGTNAAFSDVDLMLQAGKRGPNSRRVPTDWLTGAPQGGETGDVWRRVTLDTSGRMILARVASVMAEYMHSHSDRPALIAIPVDLRRHMSGLRSTGNFSNMTVVPLVKGENADDFKRKLNQITSGKEDAFFPRSLKFFKLLPRPWIDRLLSRTPKNYHKKRPFETAVISNIGLVQREIFSCDDFHLESCIVLPLAGSVFSVLVGAGDRIEMTINMPRVLASHGRMDKFLDFLKERLTAMDKE